MVIDMWRLGPLTVQTVHALNILDSNERKKVAVRVLSLNLDTADLSKSHMFQFWMPLIGFFMDKGVPPFPF